MLKDQRFKAASVAALDDAPRSGMSARPSLLPLDKLTHTEGAILAALSVQRDTLESSGIPLARICEIAGEQGNEQAQRQVVEALSQLKRIVPALSGLHYNKASGLVKNQVQSTTAGSE